MSGYQPVPVDDADEAGASSESGVVTSQNVRLANALYASLRTLRRSRANGTAIQVQVEPPGCCNCNNRRRRKERDAADAMASDATFRGRRYEVQDAINDQMAELSELQTMYYRVHVFLLCLKTVSLALAALASVVAGTSSSELASVQVTLLAGVSGLSYVLELVGQMFSPFERHLLYRRYLRQVQNLKYKCNSMIRRAQEAGRLNRIVLHLIFEELDSLVDEMQREEQALNEASQRSSRHEMDQRLEEIQQSRAARRGMPIEDAGEADDDEDEEEEDVDLGVGGDDDAGDDEGFRDVPVARGFAGGDGGSGGGGGGGAGGGSGGGSGSAAAAGLGGRRSRGDARSSAASSPAPAAPAPAAGAQGAAGDDGSRVGTLAPLRRSNSGIGVVPAAAVRVGAAIPEEEAGSGDQPGGGKLAERTSGSPEVSPRAPASGDDGSTSARGAGRPAARMTALGQAMALSPRAGHERTGSGDQVVPPGTGRGHKRTGTGHLDPGMAADLAVQAGDSRELNELTQAEQVSLMLQVTREMLQEVTTYSQEVMSKPLVVESRGAGMQSREVTALTLRNNREKFYELRVMEQKIQHIQSMRVVFFRLWVFERVIKLVGIALAAGASVLAGTDPDAMLTVAAIAGSSAITNVVDIFVKQWSPWGRLVLYRKYQRAFRRLRSRAMDIIDDDQDAKMDPMSAGPAVDLEEGLTTVVTLFGELEEELTQQENALAGSEQDSNTQANVALDRKLEQAMEEPV